MKSVISLITSLYTWA